MFKKYKKKKAIKEITNDVALHGKDTGTATYYFFNCDVSWKEFVTAMEAGRKIFEINELLQKKQELKDEN